jgi:signal transduction histidine kinase
MEWAAMELGTAIRRVQAQEALQRAYDDLEDRVEERTAEIVRASEKLRRSEEELRLLSSQLLTAEENERGRIARELHDGLGQSLSAIKFKLEEVFSAVGKGIGEADVESLGATISLVQNSVEEVRRITMDLRPSTLDDLGILATITWFSREL